MTRFDVPVEADRTALVIVDMQNDYVHPDGGLPAALGYPTDRLEADAGRMAAVLRRWREADQPVVHVRTHQSPSTDSAPWRDRYPDTDISICDPGSWGAAFYDGLEPAEGEPVVTKHRYSGFADTDLDLVLRSDGIETVALAGCLTHVCVEATGRDAFHNDYYAVFLEDCCSTTDDLSDLHDATLRNMDRFYGDVATGDELLDAVEGSSREAGLPAE